MRLNESKIKKKYSINNIIKIAILAEEPLGWGSGKHYFPVILNNSKTPSYQVTAPSLTK